ncbi:MAG: peptidase [Aphanothece sp. CMT-3BRIN-NPC111]|jgi:predicted Zn-dependent protease|nr:peptidase [Aphanothece sp. CMT-3BRIN-NPC111]
MLLKLILRRRRLLVALVLAICTGLLSIFINVQFSTAELENLSGLPPLQAHPLPRTLEQWQDSTGRGDYFSQVKPTNLGYLVWSEFPLKVYVERPLNAAGTSASSRRFQQWVEAVLQPVQEWSVYLPLVVVEQRENADIAILRSRPPLRPSFKRDTGELQLPPARSAETHYEFYIRQAAGTPAVLYHRCNILLSPDLSKEYIKAAGRHELGHALGIWGHSPLETDALYFSQVRNPPPISPRDINTLKRVYQQPTRLGWPL